MEVVTVEKSCPSCGSKMSTEIPEDDLYEAALGIYKMVWCAVCSEFQRRLSSIDDLKKESWTQLKLRKMAVEKAENSTRYGTRGASEQMQSAKKEVGLIRQTIAELEKKETELQQEFGEHKNEQTKGAE